MLLTEVPNYIKCSKTYKLDKKNISFKYIFTNSKLACLLLLTALVHAKRLLLKKFSK